MSQKQKMLEWPEKGSAFSLLAHFVLFVLAPGLPGRKLCSFSLHTASELYALAISLVLFMWLGSSIMRAGHDLQLTNTAKCSNTIAGLTWE